jgi:catechol 2,3-dioxygenase-like lactoylglutathione lyase family enzyme
VKISTLDHFSIGTSRLEETRAFYVDLLGMSVGFRPQLKSTGYWLYAGDNAVIHLVETEANEDDRKMWEKASDDDVFETGMDDHVAFSVEESSGAVRFMKDNGIAYWDRLLADRGLYQIFVRDPNGIIVELNDYAPELDKINPMTVQGQSPAAD